MEFNYDKIMKPETAIHCPTKEQANQLLNWAHNQDLKWHNNWTYNQYVLWEEYEENTCYYLYDGKISSKKWFSNQRFTIYSFEDVVIKNKTVKSNKRKVKCLNKNVKMENKEENFNEIINLLKNNKKFKNVVYTLFDVMKENK